MNETKVFVEKEFRPLSRDEATIGLLMMVKNEEKRIHVSLNSVVGVADALIIYDTGSTDSTLAIITAFAEKHRINYYILQGYFVDFSTSRNVSLDYADTKNVHFLLLLDCNDELRGGDNLRNLARVALKDGKVSAFLLCQEWQSATKDQYYNIRFVEARKGWRYHGAVHEWMASDTDPRPPGRIKKNDDSKDIILFQDRTQDDDKSLKRFVRDRELLLLDYKKSPKDPRTLFYLAQTCDCLQLYEECFYYSKLRLEHEGFCEEVFHSYLRCGNCCQALGHSWYDALGWYTKAYEHSQRVEPLIRIIDHYRSLQKWNIAYMYAKEACRLKYPEEACLFVDKGMYIYYRWFLMGIVASHVGNDDVSRSEAIREGKNACEIAWKVEQNDSIKDLKKFYETLPIFKTLDTIEGVGKPRQNVEHVITKTQFLEKIYKDLREKFPGLPHKQIVSRGEKLWKENRKKNKAS